MSEAFDNEKRYVLWFENGMYLGRVEGLPGPQKVFLEQTEPMPEEPVHRNSLRFGGTVVRLSDEELKRTRRMV